MTTQTATTQTSKRVSQKPSWIFVETKCWRCRNVFTVYEDARSVTLAQYQCPKCGKYNI